MLSKIIQELADVSSTNAKQAILEREKDNLHLQALFEAALNPFYNFYIRVPKLEGRGSCDLNSQNIRMLVSMLSGRKITGNAARAYVQDLAATLIAEEADLLSRMINRDLECNVAVGLVNRVWPDLIPEYPCMLASKMDDKSLKNIMGWRHKVAQRKMDGGRVNVHVNTIGEVTLFSRNGKELNCHGVFDAFFAPFTDRVFDGELIVEDENGINDRKTGNGIFNKAVRGTISKEEAQKFTLYLWDVIEMGVFTFRNVSRDTYKDRLFHLGAILQQINSPRVKLVESFPADTMEEIQAAYDVEIAAGGEGLIIKNLDAEWEDGRSKNMVKMKEEKDADLLVIGTQPHRKDPSLIGALILQTACGELEVVVGSGLKDEDRVKPPEFYIDKIVAIKYNSIIRAKDSPKPSLFLPIFKEIRYDKQTANSFSELS